MYPCMLSELNFYSLAMCFNPYIFQKAHFQNYFCFLTLIRLRGVLTGHQRHNLSLISTWIEIMSSPLVTFNFKMFPKHRLTQISNFLVQIWKTRGRRQVVSIDFDKKKLKIWFFNFFFQTNYIFSVWNWILCEKCFL